MADSCQDSHGSLEHIYTLDTSVLHAPTHTVSSEMTRGYLEEESFPLPTMASEPQQLLKLEVFGLFRKQDSGLLMGPHCSVTTCFPPKLWLYSLTLSILKTLCREDIFPKCTVDCFLLEAPTHYSFFFIPEKKELLIVGETWWNTWSSIKKQGSYISATVASTDFRFRDLATKELCQCPTIRANWPLIQPTSKG